jgi:hypothetical protein
MNFFALLDTTDFMDGRVPLTCLRRQAEGRQGFIATGFFFSGS